MTAEDIEQVIFEFRHMGSKIEKYLKTLKFKAVMVTDVKFIGGAAHIDFIFLKEDLLLWDNKSLAMSEKEFLKMINE